METQMCTKCQTLHAADQCPVDIIMAPFEKLLKDCDARLETLKKEYDLKTESLRRERAFVNQMIATYEKFYGNPKTKAKKRMSRNTSNSTTPEAA